MSASSGRIGRVVVHEWRLLLRDRSLLVALLLLFGLALYGLLNGRSWVDFRAATLAAAIDSSTARQARLLAAAQAADPAAAPTSPFERSPLSPWWVGNTLGAPTVGLPPGRLAALAVGQSDLLPYYATITLRGRQSIFGGTDEIENPGNLLAGRFDLAFVVIYLFPLVILALSYNMLAGEREDGTLRLLLAQPVALRTIVVGKVLARAALVGGTALLMVGLGIIAGGALTTDTAIAALGWLVVVLAYAAFWMGLAVLVNARGGSAAANALTLAALWLLFATIVPSLVSAAATYQYPAPSRVTLISAMREASNDANARGTQLLAKYYTDHPELAPAGEKLDLNDFMARTASAQAEVEQTLAPLHAAFDAQLEAQQALVRRAAVLSPTIMAAELLPAFAGTGLERYQSFTKQVLAFHRAWQEALLPMVLRRERLSAAQVAALPQFRFVETPAATLARQAAPGIAWLLASAALVWAWAIWALRRFRLTG